MVAISIIMIIVGFFLLIKGADFLVGGASNIAKKMKIPEIIIGLTIVSIGTSMPELVVSLSSAIKGFQDITIGNVIGSNMANLLLILGISAMIRPVDIKKNTQDFEIPICLLATLTFAVVCIFRKTFTWIEGVIFLVLFVAFLAYTIAITRKFQMDEKGRDETSSGSRLWKDFLYVFIGIICLKFGGDFTVNNATNLAQMWGLSEKLISITILAIGTSLPELVTSIVAAVKGNSDIAIGNVVGSNIFNILLIVGTTALVRPIICNPVYTMDVVLLLFATLMLAIFPILPPKNKIGRIAGVLYVGLYISYIVMSMQT